MTRDISSDNLTASQASTIAPIIFVDLGFDSGTQYVHSWLGDITWGGKTYLGLGDFGSISSVDEDSELTRTPLTLTLSGISEAEVSTVLSEHYQGRTATVWMGYLNPSTMQLVDDPFILYRGRMDTADLDDGQMAISVSVESRFAAWDRPKIRRYNKSDQQSRYPTDRGLDSIEQAAEKQITWGQKAI